MSKFKQFFAVYYGWFPSEEKLRTLKDYMLQILRDCIEKIPSFRDQLTKEKYEDAQGKVKIKKVILKVFLLYFEYQ